MATLESMAIRSNAALDRIEQALQERGGSLPATTPRLMREREMLRCVQLEAIAAALEALPAMQEQPVVEPVQVVTIKPTPQPTGKRK